MLPSRKIKIKGRVYFKEQSKPTSRKIQTLAGDTAYIGERVAHVHYDGVFTVKCCLGGRFFCIENTDNKKYPRMISAHPKDLVTLRKIRKHV